MKADRPFLKSYGTDILAQPPPADGVIVWVATGDGWYRKFIGGPAIRLERRWIETQETYYDQSES